MRGRIRKVFQKGFPEGVFRFDRIPTSGDVPDNGFATFPACEKNDFIRRYPFRGHNRCGHADPGEGIGRGRIDQGDRQFLIGEQGMIQRGDWALFAFPVLRASGASEIAQSSRKRNGLEIARIVCTQPPCFWSRGERCVLVPRRCARVGMVEMNGLGFRISAVPLGIGGR